MMKLSISATSDELAALGNALDLAADCVSNSEYGDDRQQAAREKNALRVAWHIYNRLYEAKEAAGETR